MIELQNEINSTLLYKGPKPQTTIEIPECMIFDNDYFSPYIYKNSSENF